jgi:hypothetical protein
MGRALRWMEEIINWSKNIIGTSGHAWEGNIIKNHKEIAC